MRMMRFLQIQVDLVRLLHQQTHCLRNENLSWGEPEGMQVNVTLFNISNNSKLTGLAG